MANAPDFPYTASMQEQLREYYARKILAVSPELVDHEEIQFGNTYEFFIRMSNAGLLPDPTVEGFAKIVTGVGIDITGSTDSTPAIQALVDSAATLGFVLYFPCGVYRINSLNVGPLVKMVGLGAGPTRFSANGLTGSLVQFKHQTSSVLPMVVVNGGGISIENIEMIANFSTAPLLHIENGFESTLKNLNLMSVVGTALSIKRANNTKWYDIFINNSGSDTQAAMVIKSPTSAEGNETNTLDVYNLTIERSKNVALDIAYGGSKADGFYAEFLRFTNLHVEAPDDSGGLYNTNPLVRVGNIRSMHLINPFIYGGPGYLIEHASDNLQTAKLAEGIFIVGGNLLGQEDNSSNHLIHCVTGNDFTLTGVRCGRFNTSVIKAESTYGNKIAIDPTCSTDGITTAWLTDSRVTTGPLWDFPGSINTKGYISTSVGFVHRRKAGIPVDADFLVTPPNGMSVVDETNNRYYIRVNGVWKYMALT